MDERLNGAADRGKPAATGGQARPATLTAMVDDRRLRITLELDLRDDEVRGRAVPDGAEPRDFVGWMGLLVVLDALLAPADPD